MALTAASRYAVAVPMPPRGVNLPLLDEQARAAFPDCLGVLLTDFRATVSIYYPSPTDDEGNYLEPDPILVEEQRALFAALVEAHDPALLSTDQLAAREKDTDFADLRDNVVAVLADATTALAQIDVDFTSLASDITALNAATTFAAARPPIVDSMQITGRTLNRQRRIIQSLVYAVRVIRWFVGVE